MTVVAVAAVVAAVGVVVVAVLAVAATARQARAGVVSSFDGLVRRDALVTLKTGEAFRGVLWSFDDRVAVVRNAALQMDGGSAAAVDGELVVLVADIAYVQFP